MVCGLNAKRNHCLISNIKKFGFTKTAFVIVIDWKFDFICLEGQNFKCMIYTRMQTPTLFTVGLYCAFK